MKTSIYLQNYERDLTQIAFSESTIKNYLSNVKVFLEFFEKKDSPKHISSDEIKNYLIDVAKNVNYQNAIHSSIKKFYDLTIKQRNKFSFIPPAKKQRKIPLVIDVDELVKKLDAITNLKHKAILSLASSVGLRVSEVINLKIADIVKDKDILQLARHHAVKLLKDDPSMIKPEHLTLRKIFIEMSKKQNIWNYIS